MVTIIIPTLNAANHLPRCLALLTKGTEQGLIEELVVVDGGSDDDTIAVAENAGARIIKTAKGRGNQLVEGGKAAKSDWLLFLHADTVLADGWLKEAGIFIQQSNQQKAAVFQFALDDHRLRARMLEVIVKLRCMLIALPYGDQGLLISRTLYDEIGGFKSLVLMEDVDIISRIGRKRLEFFKTTTKTSAERYRRDGYVTRMARNAKCLALWYLGMDPKKILERYQ